MALASPRSIDRDHVLECGPGVGELGASGLAKIGGDLRGLNVEACRHFVEGGRLVAKRRYLPVFVLAGLVPIFDDFEFSGIKGIH